MAERQKILIVDDDNNIAELINMYLSREHFSTEIAHDGEEALAAAGSYNPDLMILDVMLPGMDGYEVLRELRKSSNMPVIMLSAKGETFDKVLGLELGADDYIMKPFDTKELIARIKAVLRRFTSDQNTTSTNTFPIPKECVTYPDLIINLTDYSVYFRNNRVEMPPKELELFYFLASHPNQVFTREQLLDHIWSYDYIGDSRTVDVHIKRLREKFSNHSQWKIATVWGIGYKFEYHE